MPLPPDLPTLTGSSPHLPDIRPASWAGWSTNDAKQGELFRGEVWIRHPYGSSFHLYMTASWGQPIDLTGEGFSVDFTYRANLPYINMSMVIYGSSGGSDCIQLFMNPTQIILMNGNGGDNIAVADWSPVNIGRAVLHLGKTYSFFEINEVPYMITLPLSAFTNFSAQVTGISWFDLDNDVTRFDEVSLYRDLREKPRDATRPASEL